LINTFPYYFKPFRELTAFLHTWLIKICRQFKNNIAPFFHRLFVENFEGIFVATTTSVQTQSATFDFYATKILLYTNP
jgi:hypothetical protein